MQSHRLESLLVVDVVSELLLILGTEGVDQVVDSHRSQHRRLTGTGGVETDSVLQVHLIGAKKMVDHI